MIRRCWK